MCDVGLNNLDLWHHKFAHLSNKKMKHIVQHKLVEGLPKATRSEMKFYEAFAIWQVDGIPQAIIVLRLVHLDIWGLAKIPSFSGARYFIIFTNDFSRKNIMSFCVIRRNVSQNFMNSRTLLKCKL
jgi:hypothetical protein